MSGVVYSVDIDLKVSGDPVAKIGKIKDTSGDLAKELGKAGGAFLGGFEGAVEKVGSIVADVAKIGAAGIVAGATWGIHLNKSLEDTRISLGSILESAGQVPNIGQGLQAAGGLMTQMRKDASVLPGTFEDLVGIFRTISTSGFHSGMDSEGIKKMAERGMAAGAVMGLQSDMVGREIAQLLEGRAGAHNIFGARIGLMGDAAKKFNESTPEQRVATITAALGKYDGAIGAFGSSFSALSTTFLTNVRKFASDATAPLFEKIKGSLSGVNEWFDKNQSTVSLYADKIGIALGKAFDTGKEVFLEYGPILFDFAGKAYDKIVRLWQDAEPYVKTIGEEIKGFLKDDGAFDKIGTVLKLYIAAKGIGGMSSVAGFLSPIIGAGVKAFAGGSAVAGAAGVGGGAAGAGAAAGVAGEGALALGTGGAAAGVGAAAPLVAIGAAIGAGIYEVIDAQGRSRTVDHLGGSAYGRSAGEKKFVDELTEKGIAAGKAMGDVTDAAYDVPAGFSAAADAAQEFASIIRSLSKSGDFDKVSTIVQSTLDADQAAKDAQAQSEQRTSDFMQQSAAMGILAANALVKSADTDKKAAEARKAAGRGSGGTTIGKVEISVSTNQEAGQFARKVGAYIARDRRLRTSSAYTANFTSID